MTYSGKFASCTVAALLTASATTASAATLIFSGTRSNTDAPGPPAARCGARSTISIRNSANSTSTGTSNFGAFDATLSHCIQLPLPAAYDLGDFLLQFASGDTLFGTQSGNLTVGTPGVFNNLQNYVVTGGTGLFAGATGTFTGTGTLSFLNGPPHGEQTFRGTLDLPAVPEPATWMMMVAGFGLAGASLRRRSAMRVPAA